METPPATRPRRNHAWVWFFVALIVLSIAASASLYYYNMGQQLKPEQLKAAEKLWQEKGPLDYRLTYTTLTSGSPEPSRYVVTVRGGKVVSLVLNDRPVEEDKDRIYPRYGMTALFHDIEDFQAKDAEPGKPRTFTRALFDSEDGHLLWYVRRVMGSQERLEIRVEELKRLP